MVTLEPPVLVTVSESDGSLPTVTLPKLTLVGFDPRSPSVSPVPDNGMVTVGSEALDAIVRVPLALPPDVGVNMMLKVTFCPGDTVRGRLGAVSEKQLVEIAALLMVSDADPEFVAVAERVLLLPAVTVPKSSVVVGRERVPYCCWPGEAPTLKPWQPTRKVRPARRKNTPATFPRCFEEIALAAVFSIVSRRPVAPGSATVCARGEGSPSV
jgi:hypothetical protein